MWASPLTIKPQEAKQRANCSDDYEIANAHVYLSKTAGTPRLEYALGGRLVASKSGWILLEVPMAIVRGAFDALHEPGVELPPPFEGYDNYRAHISVFHSSEIEELGGVDKISERGHWYHYSLGPIQSVEPDGWGDISRCWFIKVRSPELEKLRKSYGLSARPKDNKYDFHITIGVKKRKVLQENEVSKVAADSDNNGSFRANKYPSAAMLVMRVSKTITVIQPRKAEPNAAIFREQTEDGPTEVRTDPNIKRTAEEEEKKETKAKTIAVDLDGTIFTYDHWRGEDHVGQKRPHVDEVLKWLADKGHKIIIWTTRGNKEKVKKHLDDHKITYHHINFNPDQPKDTSQKIIADLYIDDRGIDARKSWLEIKKEIQERLNE